MAIALTNLSNKLYKESRERLNYSAKKNGIKSIFSYNIHDILETDFYKKNIQIFATLKGIGYWLWKPYIILKSLEKMQDNEVIIYSDCGIEIISSLDPLISLIDNQDIILFANSNFHNTLWTKRDCFIFMNCDEEKYWNGQHCDASFCLFKKTDFSINFLKEWLFYGENINIISDLPNICGKENFNDFNEHRRDQSILSLLAIRYNIKLHRMPTQFGNHYKPLSIRVHGEFNCLNQLHQEQLNYYSKNPINSSYPQLLNHHRDKIEPKKIIMQIKENRLINKLRGVYHKIDQKEKVKIRTNAFKKISYSQCGEDLIIDYIFKLRQIHQPTYLDIGANHPFHLSNTALFYNSNSLGVNIEANPSLMADFYKNRPNDVNLNIGVGANNAEMDFFIMENDTLSTFSKDEAENLIKFGKKLKEIKKIQITGIEQILITYFKEAGPDLLTIDVEGLDLEILRAINYVKFAPKIICVEAAEYSPIGAGERKNQIIEFLETKNYYEYANTNLNAIMVLKDFWFI
jgi:FkbM family methyltransferase